MKVVIGANSQTGQLTGIGHYTRCLVEGLIGSQDIEELRLFSHGWLGRPLTPEASVEKTANGGPSDSSDSGLSLLGQLRPLASRSRLLVELYDVITSMSARFSLRNYGPRDVFHASDFQYAAFPGKTVVTIHDLSTILYPEFHPASRVAYINRHIRRSVERADHIIAISDFVKYEIEEKLKVPRARISTIYPGVDPMFAPLSRIEFEDQVTEQNLSYKNYFIFISTIEPRKNLYRLLDAYKRYIEIEKTAAIPLVVVGLAGWRSTDIHSELKSLAKKSHVRYLGYVDQDRLRLLLAGARALLFPSLYEGFGLPIVEAMKSGTAVMTSANSAMSEVAGEAALFVQALDSGDICEKILHLHNDIDLVKSLELRGLAVSEKFSWGESARQTISLYKSV